MLTDDSEFTDRVTLTLAVKSTRYAELCERLGEITNGQVFLLESGTRFDYR